MPSNGGTSKARIEVRPSLSELHLAEPPLPILPAPNDSGLKTHTRSKGNLSSDHHSHRVLFGKVGSGYAALLVRSMLRFAAKLRSLVRTGCGKACSGLLSISLKQDCTSKISLASTLTLASHVVLIGRPRLAGTLSTSSSLLSSSRPSAKLMLLPIPPSAEKWTLLP